MGRFYRKAKGVALGICQLCDKPCEADSYYHKKCSENAWIRLKTTGNRRNGKDEAKVELRKVSVISDKEEKDDKPNNY